MVLARNPRVKVSVKVCLLVRTGHAEAHLVAAFLVLSPASIIAN